MRAGLIAGSGFLLLLGTLTGTVARADIASCAGTGATFAGGSGTTASPYQVADDTQLAAIDDTGAGRLDYLACAFIQTANPVIEAIACGEHDGRGGVLPSASPAQPLHA